MAQKMTIARPNPKKDKRARRKAKPGWKPIKTVGELITVRILVPIARNVLVSKVRRLLKTTTK
jgi:hypothetical protein